MKKMPDKIKAPHPITLKVAAAKAAITARPDLLKFVDKQIEKAVKADDRLPKTRTEDGDLKKAVFNTDDMVADILEKNKAVTQDEAAGYLYLAADLKEINITLLEYQALMKCKRDHPPLNGR